MANSFLKEEEQEYKRFYKLSLWWVEHRALLKKIGTGAFMAVDAILILFALWTFIDGFLLNYDREQDAVARLVLSGQQDLRSYSQAQVAFPIEVESATTLLTETGYDLAAVVRNPNENWYADVDYAFVSEGSDVATGTAFLLPKQEKPILALAVVATSPLAGTELDLRNIRWQRVDKHLTGDYGQWSASRLDLEVKDTQFLTNVQVDSKTIGRVTFTVTNKTAFSYYDPTFFLVLRRGGAVVGVNQTTLASLDSGEAREVVVNWFGPWPAVSLVDVIPDINIFDVKVYKPLLGETTSDTRTRVFND